MSATCAALVNAAAGPAGGGNKRPSSSPQPVVKRQKAEETVVHLRLPCGIIRNLNLGARAVFVTNRVRSPPSRDDCPPLYALPLYGALVRPAERLLLVGSLCKRVIAMQLGSLFAGVTEPNMQHWIRHQYCIVVRRTVRRVAAGLAAVLMQKEVTASERMLSAGQYNAASLQLRRPINLGHLPSRAHLAAMQRYLLTEGYDFWAHYVDGADAMLEEGAVAGCRHCQGLFADSSYSHSNMDRSHAERMARDSAGKGSKYGQYCLSMMRLNGNTWMEGVALLHAAADQQHAPAQYMCGVLCKAQGDPAAALVWFKKAAARGHGAAMYKVGQFYEEGRGGVRRNAADAISWYRRGAAIGCPQCKAGLQRLGDVIVVE